MTVCQTPQQCVIQCILFEQATMQVLHTSQQCLCYAINTDCNPLFYYLGYSCEKLRVRWSTTQYFSKPPSAAYNSQWLYNSDTLRIVQLVQSITKHRNMNVRKLSIYSTQDAVSLPRQTLNFVYTPNLTVIRKTTLVHVHTAAYNVIHIPMVWFILINLDQLITGKAKSNKMNNFFPLRMQLASYLK